jgi:ribosomal protein S18 acetylase RimI-like enzyme
MSANPKETKLLGTIKPLCADDLEAVIAIDKALTRTSRRGFFEKRLADALAEPGEYIYVGLHADNSLVGYAMAKRIDGEFGIPGGRASLDAIGVDPSIQTKGAGHRLIEAIEEVLVNKHLSELTSQVKWSEQSTISFLGKAGFDIAPRIVLSRGTERLVSEESDNYFETSLEIDHSAPEGDDVTALSHDKIPVRSMKEEDIDVIISIDRKNSGTDRSAYCKRKHREALHQSGIRISLIAEIDDLVVGFIMARVDFGEYGRTGSEAVMDVIGVDPGFQGNGVGHALMSQLMENLSTLRVESVRTEIDWNNTTLIPYLGAVGFKPAQYVVLSRSLNIK